MTSSPPRLPQIATLDERTVQAAAKIQQDMARLSAKLRPYVKHEHASSVVRRTQVHPQVWTRAMQLAQGNARRIEVHSEREVLVHNTEEW